MRREFIATMDPKLGKLVEHVFNCMELAGEAGPLLRIEDDIRDAVREIYGQHGELFRETDEDRWRQAEQEMLRALRAYADRAASGRGLSATIICRGCSTSPGLHRPLWSALRRRADESAIWGGDTNLSLNSLRSLSLQCA